MKKIILALWRQLFPRRLEQLSEGERLIALCITRAK